MLSITANKLSIKHFSSPEKKWRTACGLVSQKGGVMNGKKSKTQNEVRGIRSQKLLSAAAMLVISSVLLISATYAWLVLSTHPELSGISMQIGSNGSLEIALLNTETRADLTKITSKVGDSADDPNQSPLRANVTWGNLVDLSDPGYGLDKIKIMPAQLRLEDTFSDTEYKVLVNGPLALPVYGSDGRIIELTDQTASAVYSGSAFTVTDEQTFGVRAIGIADSGAAEMNDIAYAKSNVSTYSNAAKNDAVGAVSSNGSNLLSIVFGHFILERDSITKKQVNSLKAMITAFQKSVDNIEMALRYGILTRVGNSGAANFSDAKNMALDRTIPLSTIFEAYAEYCPEEMAVWITDLENTRNTLNEAYSECVALKSPYTWDSITPALYPMMNNDFVLINNKHLDQFTQEDQEELLNSESFSLSLLPGSGVMADIASFVGDYDAWASYSGYEVDFIARSAQATPYLSALIASVKVVSTGSDELTGFSDASANKDIYNLGGYAIDMAFRCNAERSNLQLQIAPAQRIYSDSTASDLQGGGSYMMFTSKDGAMTPGRMLELMDAIRVTFIDEEGTILAMSKLNISNRILGEDGSIKANLYLYDYELDDERNVVLGSRRNGDPVITSLEQNTAKAVTVIVWLDGTLVDNTMVAAEFETSLDGTMNLQFASSADLVPAADAALFNSNVSSIELGLLLADEDEDMPTGVFKTGQGSLYTDQSWYAFAAAYSYAQRVNQDSEASSGQIKAAYNNLMKTFRELEGVSHVTLTAHIAEARTLAGTSDEIAGYARDGIIYTSFTEQFGDNATAIMQVDYNNNLRDEGNGILTPIYTQGSWTQLAQTLYYAEAVNAFTDATDNQLNDAITKLDQAMFALERSVYFEAYEMDGEIYYLAITDETDTYGKWYDAEFKRIINELLILDLDTGASKAAVAKIDANDYYERDAAATIQPSIDLTKAAYSNFKNDEIAGIRWGMSGIAIPDVNGDSYVTLESLMSSANSVTATARANQVDLSNIAELEDYKRQATAAINGTILLTDAEIASLLSAFASEIVDANVQVDEKIDSDETIRLTKQVFAAAITEAKRVNVNDADISAAMAVQTENEAAESAYSIELSRLNAAILDAGGTSMRSMSAALVEAQRVSSSEHDLSDRIAEAQNAVGALDTARANYSSALETLNAKIIAANGKAQSRFTIQKVDADERQILDAAIREASGLDAYSTVPAGGNGQVIHDNLVAATEAATEIYLQGSMATKADYSNAMNDLNAAIVAAGGEAQTAYNVIEYTVGNSDGYYEPTNRVVLPSAVIKLKELSATDVGTAVITARVLTKNGVVYTAEKNVTLFNKAEGISLHLKGAIPSTEQMLSEAVKEAKTLDAYGITVVADQKTVHSDLYNATKTAQSALDSLQSSSAACDTALTAFNTAIQAAGGTQQKTVGAAVSEADSLLPNAQAAKQSADAAAESALSALNSRLVSEGSTGEVTLAAAIAKAGNLLNSKLQAKDDASTAVDQTLVGLNTAITAAGGMAQDDVDTAISVAIALEAYADVNSNLYLRVEAIRTAQSNLVAAEEAYQSLKRVYDAASAAQANLNDAEARLTKAESNQVLLAEKKASSVNAQTEFNAAISSCAQPLDNLNDAISQAGGLTKTASTIAPYQETVRVQNGDEFVYSIIKKTEFVEAKGTDGSTKKVKIEIPNNETPTAYYWSVDDPSAISISSASGATGASCSLTVLKTGKTVRLTLSVKMNTGSDYGCSVILKT